MLRRLLPYTFDLLMSNLILSKLADQLIIIHLLLLVNCTLSIQHNASVIVVAYCLRKKTFQRVCLFKAVSNRGETHHRHAYVVHFSSKNHQDIAQHQIFPRYPLYIIYISSLSSSIKKGETDASLRSTLEHLPIPRFVVSDFLAVFVEED